MGGFPARLPVAHVRLPAQWCEVQLHVWFAGESRLRSAASVSGSGVW